MVTAIAPFTTQLRDQLVYPDTGISRKLLVKDEKRQAMLTCITAGTQIPEHTGAHDGFIIVIEGRGIFTLNGQAIDLEPGVFIAMPAHTLHAITAFENLALLRVVDSHDCAHHHAGHPS